MSKEFVMDFQQVLEDMSLREPMALESGSRLVQNKQCLGQM
jgi:hypothetical protein